MSPEQMLPGRMIQFPASRSGGVVGWWGGPDQFKGSASSRTNLGLIQ